MAIDGERVDGLLGWVKPDLYGLALKNPSTRHPPFYFELMGMHCIIEDISYQNKTD